MRSVGRSGQSRSVQEKPHHEKKKKIHVTHTHFLLSTALRLTYFTGQSAVDAINETEQNTSSLQVYRQTPRTLSNGGWASKRARPFYQPEHPAQVRGSVGVLRREGASQVQQVHPERRAKVPQQQLHETDRGAVEQPGMLFGGGGEWGGTQKGWYVELTQRER